MRVTCLFSWDENLLLDLDRLCLFSWDEISIVRMVARASDLDRLFVRCMCMVGSFGCWLMCLCPLFIVFFFSDFYELETSMSICTRPLLRKSHIEGSCIFFFTMIQIFLNITMVSREFALSNKLSLVLKRLGRKIDQIFQEI